MRTIISLCVPSICCMTALAVWGTLQFWYPVSLLGWAGAVALWMVCLLVIFILHMTMASAMIPDAQDAPNRQDAIGQQVSRLHDIAKINDSMIDDPSLRSRERLERRR